MTNTAAWCVHEECYSFVNVQVFAMAESHVYLTMLCSVRARYGHIGAHQETLHDDWAENAWDWCYGFDAASHLWHSAYSTCNLSTPADQGSSTCAYKVLCHYPKQIAAL